MMCILVLSFGQSKQLACAQVNGGRAWQWKLTSAERSIFGLNETKERSRSIDIVCGSIRAADLQPNDYGPLLLAAR